MSSRSAFCTCKPVEEIAIALPPTWHRAAATSQEAVSLESAAADCFWPTPVLARRQAFPWRVKRPGVSHKSPCSRWHGGREVPGSASPRLDLTLPNEGSALIAPVRQGGRALETTPHRSSPEASLLIRARPGQAPPSSRHEGGAFLPLTPQRSPAEASVLVRA